MELRQLRYFVAVAEELHFGRAAAALHIVQSAVSQQLRRLERELGATLVDRSGPARGPAGPTTERAPSVRLTEAGERFLPEARAVLAAEERALASVADWRAERAASLRLGSSAGLGERLHRVLSELGAGTPPLTVHLVSAPARERLRRVRDGDLDAAFVRGAAEAPGLTLLDVWRDDLVAALPADHPLAASEDVDLAELAGLPLRLTERENNPSLVDLVTAACRDAGFTPLPGPAYTTDQDTLAALGAGPPTWTVLYAPKARTLSALGVAFRPLRRRLSMATLPAVRPGPPTAPVRALLDACAAASRTRWERLLPRRAFAAHVPGAGLPRQHDRVPTAHRRRPCHPERIRCPHELWAGGTRLGSRGFLDT